MMVRAAVKPDGREAQLQTQVWLVHHLCLVVEPDVPSR